MHDLLYVVEHPAFEKFYDDLDKDILAFDDRDKVSAQDVSGDMITVGLKSNYQDYDIYIPIITKDKEETLIDKDVLIDKLVPCKYNLNQLKAIIHKDNHERFISHEIKVGTRFGEYKVTGELFTANSYNEYLQRMIHALNANQTKVGNRRSLALPLMQINQTSLIRTLDRYIRTRLFGEPFDPMKDNNWRVLMIAKVDIVEHIMKELSEAIHTMQTNVNITEAVVDKRYFSEVEELRIRENYSLDIVKSIYEKTGYPSNKGKFEKDFLETCDADSEVERIIKINEQKHTFMRMRYVRSDGMLASYFPDFILKCGDNIYIVETKAEKDTNNENVQAKKRSAVDWVNKINELAEKDRMNSTWRYVLLSDANFYTLHQQNASIKYMLDYSILTRNRVAGKLEL
jgi:type III restriction enzyme